MDLPIDQEMSEGFARSICEHLNQKDGVQYTNWRQDGNRLYFESIRGRTVEVEVRASALRSEVDPLYIGDDET